MNFLYRLHRFMMGRYGIDETFIAISALCCVLAFVNCFVRNLYLQLAVYVIMAFALLRVFSRNIPARSRENNVMKNLFGKISSYRRTRRQRKADLKHIYKRCPRCGAILRLPRKKGKHTTVCPKCSKKFKVRVYKEYKNKSVYL